MNILTKNALFISNIHGYRENRSTQTALLTMYDRWVKAAASGQISGTVFLDLSAAFDLVDHYMLIQKLKIYGLQESALSWINSYLSNRHQAVWVDHVYSDFLECKIGVPQGSNLGPLFFLIFFNDLAEEMDNAIDSYADDTTMTARGSTVNELELKLGLDCTRVYSWMLQHKLKLNPDKSWSLILGTSE